MLETTPEGPRERLIRLGATALSNDELLAVLLGTGSAGLSVFEISRQLSSGGLQSLAHSAPIALAQRPGLGLAKALRVLSAFELGRRVQCEDGPAKPKLDSPETAAAYLSPRHAGHPS